MNDLNIQLADFMRRINEQRQQQENKAKSDLEKHVPDMLAKGIRTVIVGYSGYGDSGGIDYLEYRGDDNNKVEFKDDADAEKAVSDYAYSLLPQGFEINEGGQGTVTLNIANRTYLMEHGENVSSVNEATFEGGF